MTVQAYAVGQPAGPTEVLAYEPRPLGPLEVDVTVTHSGICQTDLGLIDDHYGYTAFPVVVGHEAVGVVKAVGAAVDPDQLAVGQRVGVGAIAGSCGHCEWCTSGRQHLCGQRDDVVLRGTGGTFATEVRASDWRHVPPIPAALGSAEAAPLLCAGTTVFNAIVGHGVRPTDRVAVVGVGGLGHIALQVLAAWGCHVTAISTSAGKEADARRFGAHDFLTAGDLSRVGDTFDFVLDTVGADLPWDDYFATLRPRGKLCVVGVPSSPLTVTPLSLLPAEKSLVSAVVGPPSVTRALLDFAALHAIRAEVEVFPVSRIDDAIDHVRQGRARYRAVLDFGVDTH
ncbi:Alcohol dehydrogenase GroES domain protein [Kribbella flavida DSM 17836]|uniref:alcohol dehydrogenase (NADP(+)) n=1 Tax=Kribbella flavida (strain DSM 17836 / JCM 10339 / NBRC 14399) TaxID=479435 RepID=D2PR57_KRIFD|nr:NAD(P)-dependent alcohol dehydrogenase [Kribbella flavida]ADB33005.1 Alcohol dehydrogenase GroES domain protein [Kribbella flavida DSM 17836]